LRRRFRAGLQVIDGHHYLEEKSQQDLASASQLTERLGGLWRRTFVYRGELFWGGDRLDLIAARVIKTNL
jgi:2-hydroxychromene-2-carboxylate isomerase